MGIEGKIEASVVSQSESYVPDPLFKAWVEANLIYPQEGTGILTYLGEKVYGGNFSLEQFKNAYLSDEQLALVTDRMQAAHATKEIKSRSLKTAESTKDAVRDLWGGFKARIIMFSANYTGLALRGERPGVDHPFPTRGMILHHYGKALLEDLAERPELRQELHTLFALRKAALEEDEIKELEAERRDLLNYKKHGKPASVFTPPPFSKRRADRQAKSQRLRRLRRTISNLVSAYVAANSKQMNLSVDLSTPEKVDEVFTG